MADPRRPLATATTPPLEPDPDEPTAAERRTADALPSELSEAYAAALPGARAAVLARLWGAFAREPLPGIADRAVHDGELTVTLRDGTRIRGTAAAAEPFAGPGNAFAVLVDGPLVGRRLDAPVSHPARLVAALALGPHTGRLAAELDDSVANLALARAAQPAPDAGPPLLRREPSAAVVEQLVVDGHPLHPCCRTRLGMSPAEVLAYAPEHHPTVDLAVVEVPPARWLSTGAGLAPRLPVHPWQLDHVLDGYPWLRPTGEHIPTDPLMSLRTLARRDHPGRHLKTAVDVQMTSAVRIVSPAAVHNGPVLSALLRTLAPELALVDEVAAGAVLVDGEPCRSLAVIDRRVPPTGPGEVVVPLAALAAPSPADGRPLAVEAVTIGYAGHPTRFLADLLRLAFAPLIALLHLGVALEAHGQNMCVVLSRGRPIRPVYRDLGGIRISPRLLARHGIPAPPLRGDLTSDDPQVLRTKLAAALAVVTGELVAILSREYGVEPAVLWGVAAAVLRSGTDLEALWSAPLPVKATTAMRLADTPLDDRWAWVPNPMAAGR